MDIDVTKAFLSGFLPYGVAIFGLLMVLGYGWYELGPPWTVSIAEFWALAARSPVMWIGLLMGAIGGGWGYHRDQR